jgi:transcriptional regulator with XRE-family HTH domain
MDMDIASVIDQAMREKRMTQKVLSKRSGVPQATISRTLGGKSVPETSTLVKLFGALGLSTSLIDDMQPAAQANTAGERPAQRYQNQRTIALAPPAVTLDLDADCLLVWQQLQQLAPNDRERWRAELEIASGEARLAKLPPKNPAPVKVPDNPISTGPKVRDPA